MSAFNWACWSWQDRNGDVRYIGYGPYDRGHPAAAKWKSRFADDSALHIWLQNYEQEPPREVCGAAIMIKKMAFALATVYRSRYAETILESRGPMSHSGGGDPRGVIYCPNDDILSVEIYSSVRKASRATGVNPSNITRKCQNLKNHEWYYVMDTAELA